MSGSQDIEISLALQEWNVLRAGLLELPGKVGLPVLMKLEQQLAPHWRRVNGEARESDEARE